MTDDPTNDAMASGEARGATWLSLLAETSLHPGTGRELGVVDLPVAREGGTGYPVLFGSQLKGSLKDRSRHGAPDIDLDEVFGHGDAAGKLLVSDARVVLLPVRSMTSAYRWITSPHVLERLHREIRRCGEDSRFAVPEIGDSKGALSNSPNPGRKLFLEEREVRVEGPVPKDIVGALALLLGDSPAARRLQAQLTIVHDDAFAWFCRYGLPVRARNVLDEKKQSRNLWYEESLPADTLLVAVLGSRGDLDPRATLVDLFGADGGFLQVGGNETVGEGWVSVRAADMGVADDTAKGGR